MNNHGTNHVNPTQLAQLLSHMHAAVTELFVPYFGSLSADEAKALLSSVGEKKREVKHALEPLFTQHDPHHALRRYWQRFYHEHMNFAAGFSGIRIPEKPREGKWRLIMIAQGLMMKDAAGCYTAIVRAHNADWNLFQSFADLDAVVTQNVRTSDESYAIWVRDDLEPDKAYLGKSAHDADPDMVIGVTLLERLVHGAIHFVETKRHLDEKGWTLCTGSRGSGGNVPYVSWVPTGRGMPVRWCAVQVASPWNGLRAAVPH